MLAFRGLLSSLGLLAFVILHHCSTVGAENEAAVYVSGDFLQGGLSLSARGPEDVAVIRSEYLSTVLERLSLSETRDSVRSSESPLPTADILRQPTGILTLVVDGIGLGGLSPQEESAPTLYKLFHKDFAHTARVLLPEQLAFATSIARLSHTMAVCAAAADASPEFTVQAASAKQVLADKFAGRMKVAKQSWQRSEGGLVKSSVQESGQWVVNLVKGKGRTGLKEDFELFKSVLRSDSAVKEHFVFGTSLGSSDGLTDLDSSISELLSVFSKSRSKENRAVMVVLLGTSESASFYETRRKLAGQNATSTGFEGWDFVLMVWTSLLLSVVLLLLICCVPWSSELDPILLSSIKSNEHLKEN